MLSIFLQDADESIRDVLTLLLQSEGYQVTALEDFSARQASLFQSKTFNLALLDFKLDGSHSINLLQLIRQFQPRLPTIALSCNNNISALYKKAGFNGYIEKPFDISAVLQTVRRHVFGATDQVKNSLKLSGSK